jgi:PAS domain S-box-containing protein
MAAIMQTALDAIIITDHQGRIEEFNPAAEGIFGYQRASVLGRVLADCIIPPPLRAAHAAGLARYLASGEGQALDRRIELTGMRADESEFSVELTITRLPGEDPPHFIGYVRDITARKVLEEQWRTSAHEAAERASQLEAIVEAMADAVLVSDRDGAIIHMNHAAQELQARVPHPNYLTWPLAARAAWSGMRDDQGVNADVELVLPRS